MNDFLSNNPFRILGVASNNGIRIIEKNISKFKAYAKLGKHIDSKYDFNFLNFESPIRDISNLSKSQNIVLIADNKIKYSLFWFINENPFDNIALENLSKGNVEKALNTWKKCINKKSISKKNFSIYNNLSTLLFLTNLDSSKTNIFNKSLKSKKDIKEAIRLKYELITSEYFNNYKEALSTETSLLTNSKIKDFFSDTILSILKVNFDNSELGDLFKDLDQDISNSLSSNLIKGPIDNIKANINSINEKLEEDNEKGIELGKKLIKLTFKDIKDLKDIAGVDNYEYQIITDQLANQILQCGILYYNKTFDDQDYLSSYKYALSISFSGKTKTRAKDTIKHCKEEKGKNICSKCNSKTVDKSHSKTVRVYKVVSRDTDFWSNTRSVNFQYLDLKVHFCKDCNNKADDHSTYGIFSIIGGAGVGFLLGSVSGSPFAGLIMGVALGFIVKFTAFSETGIEYNHPTVTKYNREGWSTTKPSA